MDCAVDFHLNSSVSCGSPLLVHRHFGGSWKDDHYVFVLYKYGSFRDVMMVSKKQERLGLKHGYDLVASSR